MTHAELVALIRAGVTEPGGLWADFGAGSGNFTRALRELVGAEAVIHAIDKDSRALAAQKNVIPHQADFTKPLDLPPLDGALMANALHFIRRQEAALRQVLSYLRPGGTFILVEYAVTMPRGFIPFPMPYTRLQSLAAALGVENLRQVGSRTSPRTGLTMYAAAMSINRPG